MRQPASSTNLTIAAAAEKLAAVLVAAREKRADGSWLDSLKSYAGQAGAATKDYASRAGSAVQAAATPLAHNLQAGLTSSDPGQAGLYGAGLGAAIGGIGGGIAGMTSKRRKNPLTTALTGALAGGAIGGGLNLGRAAIGQAWPSLNQHQDPAKHLEEVQQLHNEKGLIGQVADIAGGDEGATGDNLTKALSRGARRAVVDGSGQLPQRTLIGAGVGAGLAGAHAATEASARRVTDFQHGAREQLAPFKGAAPPSANLQELEQILHRSTKPGLPIFSNARKSVEIGNAAKGTNPLISEALSRGHSAGLGKPQAWHQRGLPRAVGMAAIPALAAHFGPDIIKGLSGK